MLPKTNFGLYRYDRLILLRNLNGQKMDKRREKLSSKFSKTLVFSTDIQTNLKEVDFRDVTLNLQNGCFTCTHRRTIHSKSSNNYEITSLKGSLKGCSSNQEIFNTVNCQVNDVVYKYGITRPFSKKVYLGLAEGE